MPRYSEDYEKKLINFHNGDIAKLQKHFPNVAYSAIVRSLVGQFVDALENGKNPSIQFDPNKIEIK